MRDSDLMKRLEAHQFDAAVELPFSVKLARTEGWTPGFTARAITEYRRFLYLTQVSDAEITPSAVVDRVWHMHLTYTEDYWEVLVDQVLGQPLHHRPCSAEADMPRYGAQYHDALRLYAVEFGGKPPEDIWPVNAGAEAASERAHERAPERAKLSRVTGILLLAGGLISVPFLMVLADLKGVSLALGLVGLVPALIGMLVLLRALAGERRQRSGPRARSGPNASAGAGCGTFPGSFGGKGGKGGKSSDAGDGGGDGGAGCGGGCGG